MPTKTFSLDEFLTGDLYVGLKGDTEDNTFVLLSDLQSMGIRWITGKNATSFTPQGFIYLKITERNATRYIELSSAKNRGSHYAHISNYEGLRKYDKHFDDLDSIL